MKYVLIHGAWHRGELFEAVAAPLRDAGHDVLVPTLYGNGVDDPRDVGLEAVIANMVSYFESNEISDAIVVGHSYAGMILTGLADRIPDRIRRLVYWNAFVPNDGDSLNDLVQPHYVEMFDSLRQEDGGVALPFPGWREAFINDADIELAESAYKQLLPHPYQTFVDPISLQRPLSEIELPKSYINCTEDTALPHSYSWHPRLSERLGLFRLIQTPGSHELCFSDPRKLADAIMRAGRD